MFGGENASGRDGDRLVGTIGCRGNVFDTADEGTVGHDSAKHDVFPIEVGGGDANICQLGFSRVFLSSFVQGEAHTRIDRRERLT